MPRLLDYVRAAPLCQNANDIRLDSRSKRLLRTAMKGIEVIVADNVADYVYTGTDQEFWDFDDFPNLAPPFDAYWIEFKRSLFINSEVHGYKKDTSFPFIEYFGAFVQSHEINNRDWKWEVTYTFFAGGPLGTIGPSVVHFLQLDEVGKFVNSTWFLETKRSDLMAAQKAFWTSITIPINLAISFMHCKNVTLQKEEPHKRRSRQWHKATGRKLVRYHVLEIDRMKTVLATEGQESEIGLKRALHICRGHFKDYREGAGLFGKYPVLVWTPDHLRGSADQGVVLKDYKVV